MENKVGVFRNLSKSIVFAKDKIHSFTQVSDICVTKIRNLLKHIDFDAFLEYLDKYKSSKAKGLDKLTNEEKEKQYKKLLRIDELKHFIETLQRFSNGDKLVCPTDGVLEVAKEIAKEKEIKYAVIIVEVIQIIIKLSRREEKSEGLTNIDDKETIVKKNSEIIENDDCETLAAMIKIAVSDKNVTDEEMEMLKKQAIIASVSEEKLQQMIREAL